MIPPEYALKPTRRAFGGRLRPHFLGSGRRQHGPQPRAGGPLFDSAEAAAALARVLANGPHSALQIPLVFACLC